MGLQRVRHDWVTELNWSSKRFLTNIEVSSRSNWGKFSLFSSQIVKMSQIYLLIYLSMFSSAGSWLLGGLFLQLRCTDLLPRLLLWRTGSRLKGFGTCGTQAQSFWLMVQPLQGIWRWHLRLLLWQADSLCLSHQGSPKFSFERIFSLCLKDYEGRKRSIICTGSLNVGERKSKALGCFNWARLSRRRRDLGS